MKSAFPMNGTHFFLDIGVGSDAQNGAFSRTKFLEERGWRGVCANPFPDQTRSCKAVVAAVAPSSGQKVEVSDCNGVTTLWSMFATTECPRVEKATMSVGEVLLLSKAPPVIDYLNLDSQGSELEIMEKFPFKKFCVRAWTIQHRHEADTAAGIQKVLGTNGCKVKDAGPAFWARCPCSDFAQSFLAQSARELAYEANPAQKYIDILRKKSRERQRAGVLGVYEFGASSHNLMRKS
jgi:hypothetical protein